MKKCKNGWYYCAVDLINIKDNLNNFMEIYNFMDSIATSLGEKSLYKPVLIPYYHGKIKKDCGISCYSFFESGGYVTLHIFEKRKIAYFDIVSNNKIKFSIIENVKTFCQTECCNIHQQNSQNKQVDKNIFGPHYFVAGQMNKELNTDDLLKLQEEIIKGIKMTPIINPVIVKTKQTKTIFVAIAESHIALTQIQNDLRVDVFSCKNFELKKINKIVSKWLNIQNEILFTRYCKKI